MYLHIWILLNVHVAVDDKKQYHRRGDGVSSQLKVITNHNPLGITCHVSLTVSRT